AGPRRHGRGDPAWRDRNHPAGGGRSRDAFRGAGTAREGRLPGARGGRWRARARDVSRAPRGAPSGAHRHHHAEAQRLPTLRSHPTRLGGDEGAVYERLPRAELPQVRRPRCPRRVRDEALDGERAARPGAVVARVLTKIVVTGITIRAHRAPRGTEFVTTVFRIGSTARSAVDAHPRTRYTRPMTYTIHSHQCNQARSNDENECAVGAPTVRSRGMM